MGKASRTKQAPDRRAKIAAQQAAVRRRQQIRRLYLAGGSIIAVVGVVLAFVLISANNKGSGTGSGASDGPTGAALASVVKDVTTVPAATLEKVGTGQAYSTPITSISGSQPPLTSGGKPQVFYAGAEYCPFCAAERWGLVVALSRFGTFTGLATTHSAIKDGQGRSEVYPNTPTWTFANAKYTSPYLAFDSVEMNTNIPDASTGFYTTLQTPSKAQQDLITKYDSPPYVSSNSKGAIPFVDFGNKYLISGASYDPQVLAGKTWAQVAAALKDSTSPIAQAVNGTANYITAAICGLTGNQPSTVCTPTITAIQAKI